MGEWISCKAELNPDDGHPPWLCTLPEGHDGPHEAQGVGGKPVYFRWSDDDG